MRNKNANRNKNAGPPMFAGDRLDLFLCQISRPTARPSNALRRQVRLDELSRGLERRGLSYSPSQQVQAIADIGGQLTYHLPRRRLGTGPQALSRRVFRDRIHESLKPQRQELDRPVDEELAVHTKPQRQLSLPFEWEAS